MSFDVYFNDTLNTLPIEFADVAYEVRQTGAVQGNMVANGTAGWYTVELNTTQFIYAGLYTLKFTAIKENYISQIIEVELTINKIKTLLNNRIFVPLAVSVNVTTPYIFQFNYVDEDTKVGIPNAAVARYEWENEKTGESGIADLIDKGNGIYWLDFDTANLKIGSYSLVVSIGQTNYVERTSVIALSIVEKPIAVNYRGNIQNGIIEQPQGDDILIEFELLDLVATHSSGQNVRLTDATVSLEYDNKTVQMQEVEPGIYRFVIDSNEYEALAAAITFQAKITITKANYTIEPISLTISITPPEFVVGNIRIPKIFVYIIAAVGGLAIVSSLTMRYIRYAKIPTVVKRIMETKKILQKNGTITDEKVLRSFDELYLAENEEAWKALGLTMKKAGKPVGDDNFAPGDE